jgi:stearoyl-CoA desaturase (delta-9 desaturase)
LPDIGFLSTVWWMPIAFFAISGHLTNAATTIYLHRAMTHGGVRLSPVVSIPMRFWLWLSTGIVTGEWVACHRKHHAFADREGDPHSPVLSGLASILFGGWAHYRRSVREPGLIEKYGKGCPTDWLERRLFGRYSWLGVVVMLGIDLYLFGPAWGSGIWLAQMVWMPILGGVVNGIGHAWGYRNYDIKDHSRNFFPAGFLLGGEELHNNHHADPKSARFRRRWFEFDVGWIYIKLMSWVRLARVVHAAR